MTKAEWYAQGLLMGSTFTGKEWSEMNDNQQFENDGVQARINRSLKAQPVEINRSANCHSCSSEPIVYALNYMRKETKALREFKDAKVKRPTAKRFHTADEIAMFVEQENEIFPG